MSSALGWIFLVLAFVAVSASFFVGMYSIGRKKSPGRDIIYYVLGMTALIFLMLSNMLTPPVTHVAYIAGAFAILYLVLSIRAIIIFRRDKSSPKK